MTARGCLDLLWPNWESTPVPPPIRAILNSASVSMPAIPKVGLELRLGTGEVRVDLHQLVTKTSGEPAVLLDYLSNARQWCDSAAAQRLRAFLVAWCDEQSLFGTIFQRFFIEYDLPDDGAPPRVPCLFFDVHRRSHDHSERLAGESLIVAAIEQLQGALNPLRRHELQRCFDSVNGRGSIGHLGIMLGRDQQSIRLNIKDLRRGALLPLLDDLNWTGDRAAAESVFNRLIDEVDLVTVALDLSSEWLPGIGFEAFLNAQPAVDPRWQRLLDWLCEQALCTSHERQALLQFPGRTMPGPSGSPWPASWLVAAALAPPDHLPIFWRELSHIKVTLNAVGQLTAKAYLGTRHEWQVNPLTQAKQLSKAGLAFSLPIPASIEASHDFLLNRLSQGGFWHDFHLDIGFSDEWVTAFIATQIALTKTPRATAAAHYALAWLLRRQRSAGGWGFNAISPPDADSTAWVLRLTLACGVETEATRRARAFLANHLLPDGAVTTYASSTPIHFREQDWNNGAAPGWRGAHTCVAANAAPLLGTGALNALRRNQSASGAWQAYWWQTDVFATALAAESLLAVPHPANQENIARAINWAASQNDNEAVSAFDLAWRLRLTLLVGSSAPGEVTRRVTRLLDLQQPDGGWPAGAPMLFPSPCQIARAPDAPLCIDQQRNFTTASVQAALAMAAFQQTSESQVAP